MWQQSCVQACRMTGRAPPAAGGCTSTAAALVVPQTGCLAGEAGSDSTSGLVSDGSETSSDVSCLQRAFKQPPGLRQQASWLC